jgi:chromosomal replication initiator protein
MVHDAYTGKEEKPSGLMRAWEEFVKKQEGVLGAEVAQKWLHTLKVVHFDSGNLYLEAKDPFHVLWFEEHIRPLLKSALLNNNFRPIKVHLTVSEASAPGKKKEKRKLPPPAPLVFDKLDSAMTLENFVMGESNQVLLRFISEITAQTATTFNPVYFWGGSGCGKTHLLMALSHAFNKRGLHAQYARAETFTEHMISAIRSSEMQSFRKAYRHVDVLLIDDIHVFARKGATQEEFFHTFNTLHTSGRQIILSSKCAPAMLEEIEPRLVSRFEWGINIHFEQLNTNELIQMLLKRCTLFHFPLADDVISFLVKAFPSSKALNRALEALILRCHLEKDARRKRNPQTFEKQEVEEMLKDLILQQQQSALCPEKIIATISAIYGIRSEDLLGKSQAQECSFPRQIAMYLCRQELKLPFQAIGQIFCRDHSTVMSSVKQIEMRIEASDKELLSSLAEFQSKKSSFGV